MSTIRRLPAWDGLVPEWGEASGAVWLSRGATILRAGGIGEAPRTVATVPLPAARGFASRFTLARRLLRLDCYNVVPLADGRLFVSFDNAMFIVDGARWTEVQGLQRRFRILRGCCALTPEGDLYFGEYFPNRDRAAHVNVYRLAAGSATAEVVHTFAPGVVRHIHGVHWDPFARELWLCAGDFPAECRILRTADGFASMRTVGEGDESWRAIMPLFTSDAVYYATDCEHMANAVYRIDRASGKREKLCAIDGPSYYGCQTADAIAYATTAELCPSQERPEAALWLIENGGRPQQIASYRKDFLALKVLVPFFQAGVVQFPAGNRNGRAVPFTGRGLDSLGGKMMLLEPCS